ncbi:MAG: FecR domain-containing protein, partial [Chitinophagaceae bacterium]|nr:FecR domain-containing protein [Chitinophagaceae bacterium]
MDKQSDHIADLLHKKWLGILTNEEQSELERWLSANAANREFSEYLSSQIPKAEIRIRAINLEKIASEINSQLSTDITVYYETDQVQQQPAKVYLLKKSIFKYAAAVLLLLIGAAVYYVYNSSENIPVKTTPVVADNILPGSQRATLILSNGKQITLNNVISETIADGNASIKNDQGQLIYDSGKGVGFNTMSTPRGGQYKLTLSDGTRVWINAASSISYPTVFTGKTREVNITGEAYFEVAANKTKPFIVKTSTDIIEVIGTDFNVNAYN